MGNPLGLSINPPASDRGRSCNRRDGGSPQHARTVETREASRPVENGVAAIRVLAHFDPSMHEVRPQWTGGDLRTQGIERHGIIVADLTLYLNAQDF